MFGDFVTRYWLQQPLNRFYNRRPVLSPIGILLVVYKPWEWSQGLPDGV